MSCPVALRLECVDRNSEFGYIIGLINVVALRLECVDRNIVFMTVKAS